MKLWKNEDWKLEGATMRKASREIGYSIKELGTWCRWGTLISGDRLQQKLTLWELKNEKVIYYMICDGLDRVACPVVEDKAEVLEYFKTRKPELYENYMVGVTISLEGE